jgi:hypothetical protein
MPKADQRTLAAFSILNVQIVRPHLPKPRSSGFKLAQLNENEKPLITKRIR